MRTLNAIQLAAMSLWLLASGGAAIYRTLSIDPVDRDGHKCVIVADELPNSTDLKNVNDFVGVNIFDLMAEGKTCGRPSAQAIADLRLHPLASVLGALMPSIVLAPLAYWGSGVILRRRQTRTAQYNAQFKVCQYCAEKIKAEAKVCRFCGREVTATV